MTVLFLKKVKNGVVNPGAIVHTIIAPILTGQGIMNMKPKRQKGQDNGKIRNLGRAYGRPRKEGRYNSEKMRQVRL